MSSADHREGRRARRRSAKSPTKKSRRDEDDEEEESDDDVDDADSPRRDESNGRRDGASTLGLRNVVDDRAARAPRVLQLARHVRRHRPEHARPRRLLLLLPGRLLAGRPRHDERACSTSLPCALCVLVIPLFTMRVARRREARRHDRAPHHDAGEGQRGHPRQVLRRARRSCLVLLAATLALPARDVRVALAPRRRSIGARSGRAISGLFLFCAAGIGDRDDVLELHREPDHLVLRDGVLTLVVLYAHRLHVVEFAPRAGRATRSRSSASRRRFQPFARGLIDTRAVVYFLSIAVLCLLVAFRSLESRKWS